MKHNSYTQPIVRGVKYATLLPKGTALVLEGGGTRGFFTSGVFEAFMDRGIMFPYIVGVSAGAANAYSYIAGQKGRNREIVKHYVGDKRYVSFRNLFRYGSMFGYKFIFDTIPNRHIFFDREMFAQAEVEFHIGTVDINSGKAVWFERSEVSEDLSELIASCSVPLVAPIVKCKGLELLDGGLTHPIPIEKSVEDGNSFHVIVLTRNKGFRREPFSHKRLARRFYRNYPKLLEALWEWHNVYNRQLELCEELEAEGMALIIRPRQPLTVNRLTRNVKKLLALHDEGHAEGAQALERFPENLL